MAHATKDWLVLLDTGAHEVASPCVQEVWDQFEVADKSHDGSVTKVQLTMAGDRKRPGYFTRWGEVMMNNDGLVTGEDVWILPMSRLQEELGMSAIYRSGGSAALIWPD